MKQSSAKPPGFFSITFILFSWIKSQSFRSEQKTLAGAEGEERPEHFTYQIIIDSGLAEDQFPAPK